MINTILKTGLSFLLLTAAVLCQCAHASDAVQTGEFQLTFTMIEVAGADSARAVETVIPADEAISWEIYVPDSYLPEKPTGLMVYISPSMSGEIPQRWKSVMDKYNMIWVAANHSGNRVTAARRAVFALIAPTLAAKYYKLDGERIYLSGLSGGGKMAGMVAADYPRLFKGAIFNCGINSLDQHPSKQLELFKQNHYVFVTGTRDHALEQTKKVHRQYLRSGVENSKLMVIRNMTHRNPDSSDFAAAIQYLDARIIRQDPGL